MAKLKTRKPFADPTPQLLEVVDLTGGLDLRSTPTQLEPARGRNLLNYDLSEAGALTVRPGYQQFSSASLGDGRIQGGGRIYLSSAVFTLIAWNGAVYQPTDTGVWGASVYSTIASTAQVYFPYDRDVVAICDGSTNPIRKSTSGSSWTRLGIAASPSAATVASASSGALLAEKYELSYSYRTDSAVHDPPHESNGSTARSTITLATTGAIRVEMHGSTDPQVGLIRVYARNVTAGETVRRLASTLANPSDGSSASVTLSDSNWSAALAEPSDRDLPPPLAYAVAWKNRWWARHASIGNRLHFSQIFQPPSWPASFYLDIPFDRGDAIHALVALGDTLLVFGYSGIYLVIGQTSLDFEVRPALGALDGALSPRSVAIVETGVVHAAQSGVYVFDGASDRLLSYALEPGWATMIAQSPSAELGAFPLVYHAARQELRLAVSRRYPSSQAGEWILNLNRTRTAEHEAWSETDRAIGGYVLWDGAEPTAGDRGRLLSWDSTSGRLWQETVGQSANSSNLRAEYDGPTLTLGFHRGRILDVRGEYEPHNGTFQIETIVDGISQGQRTIPIGGLGASYGTAVYGTGTYAGTGRRMFHRFLPLGAQGRTLQLKTVYTGQEAFRHFTYSYSVIPEPAIRDFSE